MITNNDEMKDCSKGLLILSEHYEAYARLTDGVLVVDIEEALFEFDEFMIKKKLEKCGGWYLDGVSWTFCF